MRRMSKVGFKQHTADSMMFYAPERGAASAIAVCHVDDIIVTCASTFDLAPLQAAFIWGSTRSAPEVITFCGRQMNDYPDHLLINQASYTQATAVHRMARGADMDACLTPEQLSEYRSCMGVPSMVVRD